MVSLLVCLFVVRLVSHYFCLSQAIKDLLRNAPAIQAEAVRTQQAPAPAATAKEEEAVRRQKEAAEAARKQREDEEAARVKKEADDMAKKQKEDEEAASRANEAEAAVVLAATSNFTGLTATQMADLFVSFGEQYVGYRDNIIKMDITGALVAQSMDDNDLPDILKEVGVTSKVQLKGLEMKFKTFYQPTTSAVATEPTTTATPAAVPVAAAVPAAVVAPAPTATSTVSDGSLSTLTNSTGKHIMISYCWAQKVLVTALAVFLREKHGFDVWIDDLGSTICGKMGGESNKKMAEAVEKSHTVLVFVSKEYNESVNCQKEAKYAHQRRDQGRVNIHYVMMQKDYTTVSKPDCIEGQLGLWIGDEIWYSLFDESQVVSTGGALAELIGDQGKLVATAVGGGVGAIRALSPRP